MTKLSGILAAESPRAMYQHLTSHWSNPDSVVIDGREPLTLPAGESSWPDLPTISSRMMCLDQMTYLPDDILVKLDRATMAVSLEARVPLLDHRVAEFTAHLPEPMRRRGASDRWLLRRVLYRHVPQPLVDRPKTGFDVPIADWLRGALRPWAEELLDPHRMRQEGFLTPGPIRELWTEHLSGRRDHQYLLWDVLMFQALAGAAMNGRD